MIEEENLRREAEEWVKRNSKTFDDEEFGMEYTRKPSEEESYIAGAIAHLPQWHDLRKNSNDLPRNHQDVIAFIQTSVGTETVVAHISDGLWYTDSGIRIELPIAWCELPKFKEE